MEHAHNDTIANDCNINVEYTDKNNCTYDKNTNEDDNSTTKWYVIRRRAVAITAAVIICEFCILTC